jgi:exosortase/archaeosortase family protein
LFCKLFALTASSEGILLTISGFTITIDPGCTAFMLYAVFIAGVMAYPGHSLAYKGKGLFFGLIILVFFNVCRIIGVALVGAHLSREVFDFIHGYIFQSSFVLVVCFVWIAWLRRDIFTSRSSAAFIGIAFVGTIGGILALWASMRWYVGVLSDVTGGIGSIFYPDLFISRYEDEIVYGYAEKLKGFRIYQHVFDSALFLGLMLASARGSVFSALLRRLMGGALILIMLHVLILLAFGGVMVSDVSESLGDTIDWIIRSVSIAAPILLWLILKRGLKGGASAMDKPDVELNGAS